jgi:hypothetical protein
MKWVKGTPKILQFGKHKKVTRGDTCTRTACVCVCKLFLLCWHSESRFEKIYGKRCMKDYLNFGWCVGVINMPDLATIQTKWQRYNCTQNWIKQDERQASPVCFICLHMPSSSNKLFSTSSTINWDKNLRWQPRVRSPPAEPTYLSLHLRLSSLLFCLDALLVVIGHDALRECHHLASNS